ncbi:hypothetical protein ANN_07049 [Periplaneta americana]|uniref:Uncharacterized protein n=1 Tax=Periplaneta americana TaxID=6978 RepID=A0ABQ8TH87_PERAM|nr:hypothetical protein ANN_07049 [Periplaneta americana]
MMKSNMNASVGGSVIGGYSFDAGSLAEFSEFDSTSVVLEYQAERPLAQQVLNVNGRRQHATVSPYSQKEKKNNIL